VLLSAARARFTREADVVVLVLRPENQLKLFTVLSG
jgi:hypothetical protein